MTKVFFTLLTVAAIFSLQPAARGEIIFSDSDTMIIENIEGHQGQSADVTVFMANPSFSIGGISHRIEYDASLMEIDTVVCIDRGCNLETIYLDFSEPGVIWVVAISRLSNLIPSESGPVLILSFMVEASAPDTVTAVEFVNQAFYNNAWSDSTGLDLIIPVLVNGGITIVAQTDIESSYVLPGEFSMSQNYPNPFNNKTMISFDLSSSGDLELAVYDLLGREVAVLYAGRAEAGRTVVVWDGRSSSGDDLPSGIYFYRLMISGGETITRRMTFLK
ncbi:MAG: T9SS type A sorting domain-containing protein [Candidatus Zixiibacteriota bacterium]|nr:MAG: T9SS type A sorting domain-containing protein [candidate division Zixibacteria bacterium]